MKTPLSLVIPLITWTCLVPRAHAQDWSYGTVHVSAVRSVYDGDTFRADIAGWPAIIGAGIPIRVSGVDTPEIKGKCPGETALAIKARNFAAALLKKASLVELRNMHRGKYFRIVAEVRIDGLDLAAILINQGLGRPYRGGRRYGWCG